MRGDPADPTVNRKGPPGVTGVALSMGFVIDPISKWQRVIGHAVATALRKRSPESRREVASRRS